MQRMHLNQSPALNLAEEKHQQTHHPTIARKDVERVAGKSNNLVSP